MEGQHTLYTTGRSVSQTSGKSEILGFPLFPTKGGSCGVESEFFILFGGFHVLARSCTCFPRSLSLETVGSRPVDAKRSKAQLLRTGVDQYFIPWFCNLGGNHNKSF